MINSQGQSGWMQERSIILVHREFSLVAMTGGIGADLKKRS